MKTLLEIDNVELSIVDGVLVINDYNRGDAIVITELRKLRQFLSPSNLFPSDDSDH